MSDLHSGYPESPMEQDDAAYPCKGCGEILEEGKAFELAGNRWHIDCFRCNTCGTLLDSDANLLLLGDGSLICNNCTYSCSACGNKIEDLAILTGDQAFCATCFRCRNCKKKIENLRYARTSQGIFCMECHEGLMARRRKKTKGSSRQKPASNNAMLLDKSLPSLPPSAVPSSAFSAEHETTPDDTFSDSTPLEVPERNRKRPPNPRSDSSRSAKRDHSPGRVEDAVQKENLMLPSMSYKNNRHSAISARSDLSANGEGFFIPMALDPTPAPGPSPMTRHKFDVQDETTRPPTTDKKPSQRDYFSTKTPHPPAQKTSQDPELVQSLSRSGSRPESRDGSGPSSPHTAHHEKGREDIANTIRKRSEQGTKHGHSHGPSFDRMLDTPGDIPSVTRPNGRVRTDSEQFRLQEVPRVARKGSLRNSRSDYPSELNTSLDPNTSNSAPASASTQVKEQQVLLPSVSSPRSSETRASSSDSPHTPQEPRSNDGGVARDSPMTASSPMNPQLPHVPLRGDSLQKSQTTLTRNEATLGGNGKIASSTSRGLDHPASAPTSALPTSALPSLDSPVTLAHMNGGKTISKPMESPISRSSFDLPLPPLRNRDRPTAAASAASDSFISPRVPPHPPMEIQHHKTRNESISTIQSESMGTGDNSISPKLPRHGGSGNFSMDEDMARILGTEDQDQASFLRRVSKSVRHARSYSDRGTRLSKEQKWPKSPANGTTPAGFPNEISSPSAASPETREELSWFKNELRRERQKTIERDQKIAELEAALDGKTSIRQMNTELREKRSTMVVLDTQKEIVVRELEVLTDHIAATKRSGEPFDVAKMSNTVLREFAESLQNLKDSYAPEIEDLVQKRNDTIEEVSRLTHMKDTTLQEFEQLSLKNAQLAELNNHLVHQIQELYRANAGSTQIQHPMHGLGIYTNHQKERLNNSMDSRDLRPESQLTGSTAVNEHDAEPATILTAPQVVNIRKGQPKKFNWKKGGSNVAKGVTKGIKGAFTSNDPHKYQQQQPRDGFLTEGIPYGSMASNQDLPSMVQSLPPRNGPQDPSRQAFGFFGNQKGKPMPIRGMPNGNGSSTVPENASVLFGSELEQRAEFERVGIPGIVMRCIQEVELRGMDIEGIYRKSGGNSQIQFIREGFERSNDFDISDPDFDINAVTSSLKQYFRKLPTPLITYPIYDRLLDAIGAPDDHQRIGGMRTAISDLPPRHRDCLEFLIFHLARVVERERENLMTSLNTAVVFAPTIMRPESLAREMSDTAAKNQAVQFLIENCHEIFLGDA